MNAAAVCKKCLGVGYRGMYAIFIYSNMQNQFCKKLQCKLKCNILQQAVILLFYKSVVLKLTINCDNWIAEVLL